VSGVLRSSHPRQREDERLLQAASTGTRARHGLIGHLNRRPTKRTAACWTCGALPKVTRPFGQCAVRRWPLAATANGELVNYYQPKVAVADGRSGRVGAPGALAYPLTVSVFPDRIHRRG
jgi:hypothetical protein